jgi:hypothetical protein
MGFFDKTSSSTSNSNYTNGVMEAYTNGYRGASPWGFATLDPTATLFAMGEGTTVGGTDLGQAAKDYLKGLSADEKAQHDQTNQALARIKERQDSGQFLTASETDFINTSLDKAFEYAHKTGYEDWQKGTQALAGRQGLRTSDTPVAQPAMRELGNFELGLGSQRAQMGLSATMQMSAQQQAFDQSFVQFNQNLEQQRWATRQGSLFGGGLSGASQVGYSVQQAGTGRQNMSTFDQVMAGFKMTNATMDLAGRVGSMGGGGMG